MNLRNNGRQKSKLKGMHSMIHIPCNIIYIKFENRKEYVGMISSKLSGYPGPGGCTVTNNVCLSFI